MEAMKSGREMCPTVPAVESLKQDLETSDLVLRGKTDILYNEYSCLFDNYLKSFVHQGYFVTKRDKTPMAGIFNEFILINYIDFKVFKMLTQDIVRYSD